MALGTNIEYKARALFQAAFDEKSAKQVEDRFVKLSKEASEMSRQEFAAAFSSLGQEINNALSKLKLPTIDMKKLIQLPQVEAFSQLGAEFGTRFADGFQSAVAGGGGISDAIKEQISKLETERAQLESRLAKLPKRIERYHKLDDIMYMEENELSPYSKEQLQKMGGDIDEIALGLDDDFQKAKDAMVGLTKGTKEYRNALLMAYEAAGKVYRMSATLEKSPELVKDKSILQDFNFENLQKDNADFFEKTTNDFGKIIGSQEVLLDKIPIKIQQIDAELKSLRESNPEIISENSVNNGLKSLNEIEAAYKRILNAKGKIGKQGTNIQNTLGFDPSTSKQGIKSLYDEYTKIPDGSPWEVEYQALLKYVRLYESYLTSTNEAHRKKTENPEFKALYEQLKPMAANAENMLRNVLNMANDIPLVGMDGVGAGTGETQVHQKNTDVINNEAQAQEHLNQVENQNPPAQDDSGIHNANADAMRREAEAAKEKADALTQSLSGLQQSTKGLNYETMSLIGSNGVIDTVRGEGDIVDTKTLTHQLIGNFKESLLMSLHNHPGGQDLFTPEDLKSFANLYYNQGSKINGIIAGNIIKTIDFSNISQEVAANIQKSFVNNLKQENAVDPDERFFTYDEKSGLKIEDEVLDYSKTNPEMFAESMKNIRHRIETALNNAFTQNGLESTVKTFTTDQLPELANYLLKIQQEGQNALTPIEKLKNLLMTLQPNHTFDWGNYADVLSQFEKGSLDGKGAVSEILTRINAEAQARQENAAAINAEAQAQEKLNNTQLQTDDDAEIIAKENGALEDKLELLRDIAEQYGNNITQKQRDKYEELNQKDMDSGLTTKEDERFWELGEQIEEADSALEEFGNTYDRIIVKLANGKKVEILPDDKGLRTLAKIDEEYGESYNGVEIEDISFERVQQEAVETKQVVDNLNDSLEETKRLVKGEAAGNIGTGDASSEDLKAAQAEAEGLRTELENANERAHAAEINAEAERDLRITTENALSEEIGEKWSAEKRAKDAEAESEKLRQELAKVQTTSTGVSDGTPMEAGAEITQMNTLREAIEKVTAAVDLKTQAFFNEQSAVKRVAQSEIHALGEVEKKVTAIRVALNNIKSGTDIGAGLSNVNINVKYPDTNTQQIDYNAIAEAISKISVSAAPLTDVGNVLATENTLSAIKTAVESINGKVQQGVRGETASKTPIEDSSKAMVRYEGEPDSKISGNGSQKPTEKINTALTALLKYKTTLQEANQLSGDLEIGINNLYAELSQVSDKEGLTVWNEHFKQFKNASSIIQTLVKDYQTLGALQAKADAETDPTKLAHYLDNIQILQDRIDIKSVDVNVGDDRFEEVYQRAYNIERHSLQQKQELADATQVETEKTKAENEALKERQKVFADLIKLYEKYATLSVRAGSVDGKNLSDQLNTEAEEIYQKIMNTEKLLGTISSEERQQLFGAMHQGATQEENKQLEKMAASMDKDEASRVKELNREYDNLGKKYEALGKLQASFAQTGNLKTEHEINSLEQTIDTETKRLGLTREQIATLESRRNIARAEAKELLIIEQREKNRAYYAKEGEKANKKNFNQEVRNAQREAGLTRSRNTADRANQTLFSAMQIDGLAPAQISNLESYQKKIETLKSTIANFPKDEVASEEQKSQLIKQRLEVDNYTKEIQELIAEYQRLSGDNVKEIGTNILDNRSDLEAYKKQLADAVMVATNGKAQIKGFDATTKTLTYTIKTGAYEFTEYTAAVRNADNALVSVQGATKKTETVFEGLKRKTKELLMYFGGSSIIYKGLAEVRKGIQYVREIDSALTELKKVTDETEESYERFLNTASKTADKIGSTVKEIVNSTADWARLGYSMEEAAGLAESTSVLLNVSEFQSIDEATSALTSTLQAFSYTADESMHVVDVMNEVGNNFAVSSDGIATALQDSASALMTANNSYEQSVALIAAANRVVQDPNSVGSALRTISLRLRGTSTKELEEAGEDTTGVVESKSKLRTKIKGYTGIDILTDSGAYKGTYEILLEISKVWDNLTDQDRAGLLEIIAGKNRANTAAAILSNTKDLEAAYESAMEAEGSALAENEKYLDSIQGRIDLFNNAVQTMWSNTLDDEVIKDIVNLGTELIKIIDSLGLIKTLVITIGTYLMTKYNVSDAIGGFFDSKTLNKATERLDLEDQLKQAKEDLDNLWADGSTGDSDLGPEFDAASQKVDELNNKIKQNGMSVDEAKKMMQQFGDTTDAVGRKGIVAWDKLKTGAKKFGKQLLKVTTSMMTMYAITTAFELVGKVFNSLNELGANLRESPEEAQEKFEELNAELSTATSELKSLESELDGTNDRIEELMSMGTLSFVEQEELNNLRKQSDELKSQITLAETLKNTLQDAVNLAAINASQKMFSETSFYATDTKEERVSGSEETGSQIGGLIGYFAGNAAGTAIGTKIGAAIGSAAAPGIGTAIGAAVGMIGGTLLGGFIGKSSAEDDYESEQTIEDVLKNMKTERVQLEQARDDAYKAYVKDPENEKLKEQWEDAQAELGNYDATLAKHMTQMQQYLNSIDPKTLTNPADKAYYDQMQQWVDTYSVMMGDSGAKANIIDRMFGENATEEAVKLRQEIKKAIDAGEDIHFDDFDDEEFDGIRERLYGVGLSIEEVIAYFRSLKEAEEESTMYETSEMVSSIAKLSSGINDLKKAFDEFNESGVVTAETLVKLNETFGHLDGWQDYIDAMSSGTISMKEAADITNQLAEDYLMGILDQPFVFADDETTDVNERLEGYKEYFTTLAQLRSLGVANAKELVDAMQQKAITKVVADEIKLYDEAIKKKEAGKELSAAEQEILERGNLTTEQRIEAAERRYGIELKNTELIEDQTNLTKAQEDIERYESYKSQFDGGLGDILIQYKSSLEKYEGLSKEYSDLKKSATELAEDGYDAIDLGLNVDEWDEMKEIFTLGKAETNFDVYDDTVAAADAKFEAIKQSINDRIKLFNQLKEIAKTEGIDLEGMGIPLDEFYASDDSEDSVFNQVYNAVKAYLYGEDGNGGKMAEVKAIEEELKEKLDTAFDAIGLEVTLDLLDKDKLIDDIQSVYDTLKNAQKEYADTGYLSIDTMQSLLGLEPKYLALLYNEEGQLELNEEALYRVAEARIIDMGIAQQKAILEQALALATNGSRDALLEYVTTTETATEANKDFIKTQLALLKTQLMLRTQDQTEQQTRTVRGRDGQTRTETVTVVTKAADLSEDEANKIYGSIEDQVNSVQATVDLGIKGVRKGGMSGAAKSEVDNAFKEAMNYWENRIGANQAKYEQIQNEIDLLEKKGKIAGKEYYQEQINLEDQRLKLLEQQKAEVKKFLGTFKEGSDEWWEVANTLNDIEGEIDDVTSSVQDLRDAMADIDWKVFDETHERYSSLIDDLDTIRDLISPNGEEDWFDDEGMWTDKGVASLATYIQQLKMYEKAYDEVTRKLNDDYSLPYAGNEEHYKNLGIDSEQELYDAREKLTDQQYDYSKAISDTQQSVADMYESQIDAVEEWSDKAIEAYNDYVDVVKEALDAERDLYEFKKDIQKQTKDIASLERRIASLSGSDNAADIAERRKLEAELYEAREGLNDTYYSHAKDAQQQALEEEVAAYEESMNRFIENLRNSLDDALLDIDGFMGLVANAVITNAPVIKEQYEGLGLSLDSAIIDPWTEAANAITTFGGANGLGVMNSWITEGGAIYKFDTDATKLLQSPWNAGKTALSGFESSVNTSMSNIVSNIKTNVDTAKGYINGLSSVYSGIYSTTTQPPSAPSGDNSYVAPKTATNSNIANLQQVLNDVFNAKLEVDGKLGPATTAAIKKAQQIVSASGFDVAVDGKYGKDTYNAILNYINKTIIQWKNTSGSSAVGQGVKVYELARKKLPTSLYAKGTLGTTRDELAITDESWIGEEITLAAGKNGQLQYLKKGSAVMPADISANLVEWGKLNPNTMNVGGIPNLNMISNAINKPEFNLSFDALVKADRIDEGTLPEIKKYVTQEINSLVKQMNYAIKGFAR